MRVRTGGGRLGVGRKRKERPRGKESWLRRPVWRAALISSVAKLFGSGCCGVSAANLAQLAAQFAKVWRGKSRSGRQRKSTALFLLSKQISLSCGRDADRRWPESQVVSGCRWVVCPCSGLPHRSGERRKSAAVWLLARRSRQPRCEGVWPRLRAGFCRKAARACRESHLTQSRQAAKS